jgi:hypothetical protein
MRRAPTRLRSHDESGIRDARWLKIAGMGFAEDQNGFPLSRE